MKKSLLMSLVLMFTFLTGVLAQTRTVSGRVTDRSTGSGLPGVTVLLKGTSNGVSSNADGAFSLSVPSTGGTLVFSSVGMTTQERALGTESEFSIALSTDTKQLNEVVVTGYGAQQERRDIIGSIATVKSSDYKDQPIIGVDQALQGRAAGVQVIQNSGTPGGGISVRVRGAASIGASNEPLYVVDGLPISTGNTSQLASGGQLTNGLNDINPNDIESIEVLKDAASAAIYGSRASNGVVLITTKRGKSGKARVDLDYYAGSQTVWKKPQVINGAQQTQLFLDAAAGRYPANAAGNYPTPFAAATGPSPVVFRTNADLAAYLYGPGNFGPADANGIRDYVTPAGNPIRPLSQFQNPSTSTSSDFVSKVLRTAPISNYGVTFSGGNDASRFRLAVNYFDQQGTIVGSGFKRGSARLSLDNKLSEKVRMGASIGITQSNNNRINNDNSIYGVLTTARLYATDLPTYNADGTYYKNGSLENPIAAAVEPIIKSTNNRLIGSQYTEFELIKNLRYRATFGLDYTYGRDDRFYSTLTNAGAAVRGEATLATLQDLNFNHISAFNYSKTLAENHNLSALLVFEYQRDSYSDAFSQVTGFPSNSIRELSAGATKVQATSSSTGNALFGTLAKLDYSFKGRYLLGASVRRDQGSRFGADNQVGYFPAFSAGWRILEESFLKDQTAVSELKLRGSFGETGNQPTANFGSRGLIGPGANYLDQGGLALTQLANPNLKWERTKQTNVGIDFGFLQNRFYISADVYQRKTSDLLLAQRLPNDTGFASYSANIGNIENKGLEFALTTVNFRNEGTGFNWETNFNISFNRNEVTKLSDQALTGSAQGFASRLIVGQPLGAFYGYRVDHIFQTQEEINALNASARVAANNNTVFYQGGPTVTKPGDIMFKDISGPNGKPDGRITADDQEIIGTAQPKFYGGITNTIRFMNFDFSAFLQYNVGSKVFNASKQFTQGMSTTYSQDVEVLNRWTPTNTNTDVPRAVFGDPNQNNRNSDRFLESGSFARFKSVSLGYTLPTALATTAHVRTVRVFASAQNLVTFTKYTGLDPEVNTANTSNVALNTDFFTFPQARTITGGVTLGF